MKTTNAIDLHGYHIHEAWKYFNREIEKAYYQNKKRITVITGQGDIMREMPNWISNHRLIMEYRQHKWNPGSFTCILVKGKQPIQTQHPVDLTGLYKKFNVR